MPIYTRAGDTGSTSLFGGKKVLKCEELVDVYGSIDELNSWLGLVISQISDRDITSFLQTIQRDLFTIGSTLAGWNGDISMFSRRVTDMEHRIDAMEKTLPPLNNFILPGGSTAGSEIHVARSICRRVERQTVSLHTHTNNDTKPFAEIIQYLNRLSDYLFMFARFVNQKEGKGEIVWNGKSNK
jgi:cob(I)alamin adenosyltransferase